MHVEYRKRGEKRVCVVTDNENLVDTLIVWQFARIYYWALISATWSSNILRYNM